MAKTYFTADTHFGHANIIKHCNRPFQDPEDMDNSLIERWNCRIKPEDTVYHLGDFSFRNKKNISNYLGKLHGNIHLILGNHDEISVDCGAKFKSISPIKELYVNLPDGKKQFVVLCHYAMRVWNHSHHGAWHLFGHTHGTLKDDPNSLSLDVGVDCWNFYPVSIEELQKEMAKKTPILI
jgi:calcineurin-like phosphoesterase family protein